MEKIIFIVPYYGKLPGFFREWAYTAGFLGKQNIDFLLVTDLAVDFPLPDNIFVMKLSLEALKEKIQACLDFTIVLDKPYKLCDYKPTYGIVFNDEIKEYAFWGHCDIDMFWGNVRKFITDDILNAHDKIQYMGHFVLYRNCQKMNELFRTDGAIYDYKHIYSTAQNYSFDEHPGIMQIVVKKGIKNYIKTNQADISPRYTRTIISREKNYKYQILYWHDGNVYRKYIDEEGNVGCDEFMYAHFQRKYPQSLEKWNEIPMPNSFMYRADKFLYIKPEKIDKEFITEIADYVDDAVDKKENWNYNIEKIKQFLRCNLEEKIIWIKQRNATRNLKKRKDYFMEQI